MDDTMPYAATSRSGGTLGYLLPFLIAPLLVSFIYLSTFQWWWFEWTYPGSFYAHAVFVPFFVMIMVWRNRESLAQARWQPSWAGLALIVPALLLLLVAQRSDITVIKSISFDLLLLGSTLLLFGIAKTRLLLFPLLFVVMMMPLVPDQLINGIAFPIQITSARLATKLLNLITLSALSEGTQIKMEHYRMAVELPCSGFKTLLSLLTFSAAFAYLVEAPVWKRWTLFLTTAPLSLIINALRITFIGIVGELVSGSAAATFHDYSGFIVLIMAFTFLFNFARVLRCERFLGLPLNAEEEKRDAEAAERAQEGTAPAPPAWWQEALAWRPEPEQLRRALPYIVALDLVLGATALVQGSVHLPPPQYPVATTDVPLRFTVDGVTYAVPAEEQDQIDKLPKAIQEELNPIRVINRDYVGSDGSKIQFFLTAGNGRKVFHDPHTCSLGSDATLRDIGNVDIPGPNGINMRLLESSFKHTGLPDEYEMMFCYVVEGKIVQRTEQVRNQMIRQMLLGDGGQPSYFFRVFQEQAGTDEQKRQQLKRFISGMWNEIGPILSGQKKATPQPLLAMPTRERHA